MKETQFATWKPYPELFPIFQCYLDGFPRRGYPYPEVWFDYLSYTDVPCPECGHTLCEKTFKENCTAHLTHADRPWPDILRSPENPVWAVSSRVVADMEAEHITGYRLHPLVLSGVAKKYRPKTDYWLLEICGGIVKFDAVLPPELEKWRCARCRSIDLDGICKQLGVQCYYDKAYDVDISLYGDEDWATSFFDGSIELKVCSRRIVELAHRKGWTNAHFGVLHNLIYANVNVDYLASNWYDLLVYDVTERNNEVALVDIEQYSCMELADHATRKKVKEMKARGEMIMPAPRPEPIYDLHQPPVFAPVSEHLFDNLGASDGTAWQSSCDLLSTFGPGDLIICVDEDNESDDAEDVPTKGQRRLYDFFVANQERLLPMLHQAIVHFLGDFAKLPPTEEPDDQALMAEMVKIATAVSGTATFVELKPWLEKPFVEIGSANARGRGTVGVSYSIVGTSLVINVEVACNPAKQEMAVKDVSDEVI